MASIVIDPGHGGSKNTGDSSWNNAVGPGGTLEKTLTLQVSQRAAKHLRAMGHKVALTRDTDTNLGLAERADVAKRAAAEAFLSVHFNGSEKHNAQGTETLIHTNHSVASGRLSLAVQDAVLAATGLKDRNRSFNPATRLKPQSLGVLKPSRHLATTAGCLAEISFLDRADEEARLADPAYLDAIGQALAKGVVDYLASRAVQPVAHPAELEDAIGVAAAEAGLSEASFLKLDVAPVTVGVVPAADLREFVAIPAKPFSDAFLSGEPGVLAVAPAPAGNADYHAKFANFIRGLRLSHFEPDEFLELGSSNEAGACAGRNTLPPEGLWPHIAATAQMISEIRLRLGAPIRILSAYRSLAYNSCINGEDDSRHVLFNAIDFTCAAGTPEVWRRVAQQVRASDPKFRGGIGTYMSRRFLHIDTRGQNVEWTG